MPVSAPFGSGQLAKCNCPEEQVSNYGLMEIKNARFRRNENLFLEDGTRLGNVGVELLDDVAILLFDNAALQLERVSKAAIIESKILRKQGKAFDRLILR